MTARQFLAFSWRILEHVFDALERVMPRPVATIIILWMLFDFWLVWRLT